MTSLASTQHTLDRTALVAGAQAILDEHLWCVVEVCVDAPVQNWEPRLLVCRDDGGAVATVVDDFIWAVGGQDVRLAGYTRDTLRRVDEAPAPLCHVAGLSDETLPVFGPEGS